MNYLPHQNSLLLFDMIESRAEFPFRITCLGHIGFIDIIERDIEIYQYLYLNIILLDIIFKNL